jgi:hypothetical protein
MFSLIPFTEIVKSSDTLYEYSDSSQEGYFNTYGTRKFGQVFKIGFIGANQQFTVTSIKVYVKKAGSLSAKVKASIYAVSLDLPTGSPVAWGYTPFSSLPSSAGLYEFNMNGSTAILNPSTKYALVLNTSGGSSINCVYYYFRNTDVYSPGGLVSATDGVTWSNGSYDTSKFYVYGIPTNIPPTITLQYPTNSSTAISLRPTLRIWANDTDLNLLTITWQTNNTGSYITKQVNSSFTANTICRYYFSDCTIQFKKYYWRVYVNDGTVNISKWFIFTTTLMSMNVHYTNICYANNSIVNYTYNFTILSDRLDNLHKYLNLSFTKNTTQGFNTTTKIYFDGTLLNTWNFINGTKNVDVFDTIPFLYNGTKYTWSINTTYYNLSYNISYNFTFEILFDNLNLTGGNCSFDPNATDVWLYLGAMLTLDNGQFFLLILIGLWSYFIYLFYREKEVIFAFCIICCGLPLGIILSGVAYYNSYPFGYLISFILIIISFLIPTYSMYQKNKKKKK